MKCFSIAASAAALAFAANAQAYEVYTDYAPSKEVWNVTMVNVNPNRIDDYLEGLEQTWWSGCEIGKKLGTVVECGIYMSETAANRDFNLLLVTKFPDAASGDPNPEMFKKFQTEMRAQLEEAKQDKLVEGYEELRTFFGEQNFRRIEFK
ncbi:MAG: hypothetical protein ACRETI_07070 [Steroidobacteraceae bacterium]